MKRHCYLAFVRLFIRMRRFALVNILHADDPPHRLALGLAIGIFVTFTPTIGLQMFLVVALASLFRANIAVGVPIVWISNPATFVPIYYPSYWLGRQILGSPPTSSQWWAQWNKPPSAGVIEVAKFYWALVFEIAAPLWLGCLVVASALSALVYMMAYQAISRLRKTAIHPKYRGKMFRRGRKPKTPHEPQQPPIGEG